MGIAPCTRGFSREALNNDRSEPEESSLPLRGKIGRFKRRARSALGVTADSLLVRVIDVLSWIGLS